MDVTAQWADSLLALERLLFLKLTLWGAFSVAIGTTLVAASAVRNRSAAMLRGVALTLATLGGSELAAGLVLRNGADLRDLASATTLDRALWLSAGFAIAMAASALALALRAMLRRSEPDPRTAGIAIGIGVHGAAVAVLSLQLARAIVR